MDKFSHDLAIMVFTVYVINNISNFYDNQQISPRKVNNKLSPDDLNCDYIYTAVI